MGIATAWDRINGNPSHLKRNLSKKAPLQQNAPAGLTTLDELALMQVDKLNGNPTFAPAQANVNLDTAPAAIAKEISNRTQPKEAGADTVERINNNRFDYEARQAKDYLNLDPNTQSYVRKVVDQIESNRRDPAYGKWLAEKPTYNAYLMEDPAYEAAGRNLHDRLINQELQFIDLNTQGRGLALGYNRYKAANDQQAAKQRLAGDKINEVFGEGAFGVVYPSDREGYIIKAQGTAGLPGRGFETRTELGGGEQEVNFIEASRGLHMAPEVASLELSPNGDSRIEMKDVRKNYSSYEDYMNTLLNDPNISYEDKIRKVSGVELKLNKQLANFADRGYALNDRHSNNVQVNNMTGTPTNIDFGLTKDVADTADQIRAIETFTSRGFESAGLGDIGQIYTDTVADLFNQGKHEDALDLARQGLSKLQEIERPLKEDMNLFNSSINNPNKTRLAGELVTGRLYLDNPNNGQIVSPI